MKSNIARMQDAMSALKVRFRPHVKTTKCLEIVRDQIAAGARGITVSTLKEAEQFFAQGITDIMYAVGMVPHKLSHALKLIDAGCELKLIVDSVAAAQAIARCRSDQSASDPIGQSLNTAGQSLSTTAAKRASNANTKNRIAVYIEVDTDGHRSGVKPSDPLLLDIAAALEGEGSAARLEGVMTHAGASYDLNTPQALQAMAEQERSRCVEAAERLRTAGYACPEVSVGSTPTALSAKHLTGVTEVRAGVYVFFDLVMSNVGVCAPQDIALSVLTTVIGHQAEKGWAIVDAGWMAMSRDRGTQKQSIDYGYGQVCDLNGQLLDGYVMDQANQEHGIVASQRGLDAKIAERFPVGTLLRILPNHACATGAQFPEYVAVKGNEVLSTWPRFYGW
jgi:D-serine deaminase-like pyridoxal phosphate-dependent protein